MKFNVGIYKIVNIITKTMYVGSSKNLKDRKYQHFKSLRKGKHSNNHLQHSFNKHGEDSFKWEFNNSI